LDKNNFKILQKNKLILYFKNHFKKNFLTLRENHSNNIKILKIKMNSKSLKITIKEREFNLRKKSLIKLILKVNQHKKDKILNFRKKNFRKVKIL
jgi:hypothetical protein